MSDKLAGQVLSDLVLRPTEIDLFLYSAACWLPHRIHYDHDYALSEGHRGSVIHGPLQAAYLLKFVDDWARARGLGRIGRFTYRLTSLAILGDELVCRGKVARVIGEDVECDVQVALASSGVATCRGTIWIKRR